MYRAESSRPPSGLAITLALLMAFASISTDLYLPAMPRMARDLAARPGELELTLSTFLVGFSLGQMVWGPVSDAFGRRRPLFFGVALFIIASLGCSFATSVWQLTAWRVLQALGSCVGPVVARAIVRDCFERDAAARMLSTLALIMGVAPILAPLAGGQIMVLASWRAIFWTLGLIGMVTGLAVYLLPETHPAAQRTPVSIGSIARNYRSLMSDRAFMAYALIIGSLYAGVYAYIAATPFIYIDYYGVTPQAYGWLFGAVIVGMMAMNVVNARLVMRLGTNRILRFGVCMFLLFGSLAGLVAWQGWGRLVLLVEMLVVAIAASSLIVANAIAAALAGQAERAGAASAMVGAIQYGCGIAGTLAVSWLADGTPRALGFVMIASALAVATFGLLAPRR